MRIGELSRRSGISVRMLRYYEAEGLLKPTRATSGYRDFGPAEERTAQHIRKLVQAGLKVDQIRRMLPCVRGELPHLTACPALIVGLRQEVEALSERIDALSASRRVLQGYLRELG